MRRVTSKSVIARNFVFKSKCMFSVGLRPTLLRELRRFPDLIFRPPIHQKGFGGRAPPRPAGEPERSPRSPAAVGAMEWNTL